MISFQDPKQREHFYNLVFAVPTYKHVALCTFKMYLQGNRSSPTSIQIFEDFGKKYLANRTDIDADFRRISKFHYFQKLLQNFLRFSIEIKKSHFNF